MFAKGGCLVCQNHALPGLLPVFIHGFVVFSYSPEVMWSIHSWLSRYQRTVFSMPSSNCSEGSQQVSFSVCANRWHTAGRTCTVGDVGDGFSLAFGGCQQPIDGADDDFNQVDVLPFVESADIARFRRCGLCGRSGRWRGRGLRRRASRGHSRPCHRQAAAGRGGCC